MASLPVHTGREGLFVSKMASVELEDLRVHLSSKMAAIQRLLQLKALGNDQLADVGSKMAALHLLLDELEAHVNEQASLASHLRRAKERMEALRDGAMQMSLMNMCIANEHANKKPVKEEKLIKDVTLISPEEFEAIPRYLRGRLTLPQINGALESIRAAAILKYDVLRHPPQSLPVALRPRYQRFRDEETNETRDATFVVEADLKELGHVKLDRRWCLQDLGKSSCLWGTHWFSCRPGRSSLSSHSLMSWKRTGSTDSRERKFCS
uniref:SKA complex subunit 1 n=1 Tax=Coturnix japonica TaxID=93934 RepID=A0A8C2SKV8_COTJA